MIFLYILFFIFQIILTKENDNKDPFMENRIYELNDTSIDNITQ